MTEYGDFLIQMAEKAPSYALLAPADVALRENLVENCRRFSLILFLH